MYNVSRWSHGRPSVLVAGRGDGRVATWDLVHHHAQPALVTQVRECLELSHLVTLHCDYLYAEQVAGPDTAVTDLQFSPAGDLVLVSTEAGEMEALYKPQPGPGPGFHLTSCIIVFEPKN